MYLMVLKQHIVSVRLELNNAINGIVINKNNNLNLKVNKSNCIQKFDNDANTKVLTELIKQLEISKLAIRKDRPLIKIIDSPILQLTKEFIEKTSGILLGGFIIIFGFSMSHLFLKTYF